MITNEEQILSAAAAGTFSLGGDLTVNRMGYGAMRISRELQTFFYESQG